jgi:uncharacterized membrane protein
MFAAVSLSYIHGFFCLLFSNINIIGSYLLSISCSLLSYTLVAKSLAEASFEKEIGISLQLAGYSYFFQFKALM